MRHCGMVEISAKGRVSAKMGAFRAGVKPRELAIDLSLASHPYGLVQLNYKLEYVVELYSQRPLSSGQETITSHAALMLKYQPGMQGRYRNERSKVSTRLSPRMPGSAP